MRKKDRIFFDKCIAQVRQKILAGITDPEIKAMAMASVGAVSGNLSDFSLMHDLLNKSDSDKNRIFLSKKLADTGFLNEARDVASGINDPKIAFKAYLHIASITKTIADFWRVKTEIVILQQKSGETVSRNAIESVGRPLIQEFIGALAEAGEYEWAMDEVRSMEYGEYMNERVAQTIIRNSYAIKENPSQVIIGKKHHKNLELVFKLDSENGSGDNAIAAINLLLKAGKTKKAIKLVEGLSDELFYTNYIKAMSFDSIARETQEAEYIRRSAQCAMKLRTSEAGGGRDQARQILSVIGVEARSLYHLGLAIDIALKEECALGDIERILSIIYKLKAGRN